MVPDPLGPSSSPLRLRAVLHRLEWGREPAMSDLAVAAILLVPAYLLGTFPSALLVARVGGHDVLTEGSGNPGASNVARLMGWKAGLVVLARRLRQGRDRQRGRARGRRAAAARSCSASPPCSATCSR